MIHQYVIRILTIKPAFTLTLIGSCLAFRYNFRCKIRTLSSSLKFLLVSADIVFRDFPNLTILFSLEICLKQCSFAMAKLCCLHRHTLLWASPTSCIPYFNFEFTYMKQFRVVTSRYTRPPKRCPELAEGFILLPFVSTPSLLLRQFHTAHPVISYCMMTGFTHIKTLANCNTANEAIWVHAFALRLTYRLQRTSANPSRWNAVLSPSDWITN